MKSLLIRFIITTLALVATVDASAAIKIKAKMAPPIPGTQMYSLGEVAKSTPQKVTEILIEDANGPTTIKTITPSTLNVSLKALADREVNSLSEKDLKKIQNFSKMNKASVYEVNADGKTYFVYLSANKTMALTIK